MNYDIKSKAIVISNAFYSPQECLDWGKKQLQVCTCGARVIYLAQQSRKNKGDYLYYVARTVVPLDKTKTVEGWKKGGFKNQDGLVSCCEYARLIGSMIPIVWCCEEHELQKAITDNTLTELILDKKGKYRY